jgi:hypothetical protein
MSCSFEHLLSIHPANATPVLAQADLPREAFRAAPVFERLPHALTHGGSPDFAPAQKKTSVSSFLAKETNMLHKVE